MKPQVVSDESKSAGDKIIFSGSYEQTMRKKEKKGKKSTHIQKIKVYF